MGGTPGLGGVWGRAPIPLVAWYNEGLLGGEHVLSCRALICWRIGERKISGNGACCGVGAEVIPGAEAKLGVAVLAKSSGASVTDRTSCEEQTSGFGGARFFTVLSRTT